MQPRFRALLGRTTKGRQTLVEEAEVLAIRDGKCGNWLTVASAPSPPQSAATSNHQPATHFASQEDRATAHARLRGLSHSATGTLRSGI